MKKYYLLSLNGKLLLLSDEEIKTDGLYVYNTETNNIVYCGIKDGIIRGGNKHDLKILAGHANLPQIKFINQVIEDEYSKRSGWVNVDRIFDIKDKTTSWGEHGRYSFQKYFQEGVNYVSQLKQFSEDDMIEFVEWCQKPCLEDLRQTNVVYISSGNFYWHKHKKYMPKELLQLWQSQRQQLIQVELEMEDSFAISGGFRPMGEIGGKRPEPMFYSTPKLTSNSYIITKIL